MPSVLGQCWLGVRKSTRPAEIEWWGVGEVICLERGADCLHVVQLMPLPSRNPISLASFKSRLDLPLWYRLTQVVLEKRLLKWCCSSTSVAVVAPPLVNINRQLTERRHHDIGSRTTHQPVLLQRKFVLFVFHCNDRRISSYQWSWRWRLPTQWATTAPRRRPHQTPCLPSEMSTLSSREHCTPAYFRKMSSSYDDGRSLAFRFGGWPSPHLDFPPSSSPSP